jgi:hypothetical protein
MLSNELNPEQTAIANQIEGAILVLAPVGTAYIPQVDSIFLICMPVTNSSSPCVANFLGIEPDSLPYHSLNISQPRPALDFEVCSTRFQ